VRAVREGKGSVSAGFIPRLVGDGTTAESEIIGGQI
jgi:hypothetical protein